MDDEPEEVDQELQMISRVWGSEKAVHDFLQNQFAQINSQFFRNQLAQAEFQIKPIWLSKGLMGERHSGADYEPPEGDRPACIGVFTALLSDKDRTLRVLVHEMIHHWGHTVAREAENESYPAKMDAIIKRGFPDPAREDSWRRAHSRRFISKAYRMARALKRAPKELLFGS